MNTKNSLFFASAYNADGEKHDLLVIASDAVQAEKFFLEHYEFEESEVTSMWVRGIPGVTPTAAPGPISWELINPD